MQNSIRVFLLFFLLISCKEEIKTTIPVAPADLDLTNSIFYSIDLNNIASRTFRVKMFVDNLTNDNAVFQFAATAPGIYQIADFGRFVTAFKAFDENHNEISVTHPSTNQWRFSSPERVRLLEFDVSDTFHHNFTSPYVSTIIGTSIESNFVTFKSIVAMNLVAVLGYPTGLVNRTFYLKIDKPSDWKLETALTLNAQGYFYAASYDDLIDAPILSGPGLVTISARVENTEFKVAAYSNNNPDLNNLIQTMMPVWEAESKFLKGLPVDTYQYLLYVDNNYAGGGQEHAQSSFYTLGEESLTNALPDLKTKMAHEFFHIITPISLHSNIIENFNFATPTASGHLWWYEGVTVWASIMMQYRGGIINLPETFNQFGKHGDYNVKGISLSKISLNCYSDNFSWSYAYNRGAMAAALLDIRLLELSGGSKGLRELVLELYAAYRHNPFPDNQFFSILVQRTYPEIEDFLNRYVVGTEALPIDDYLGKVGLDRNFQKLPNQTASQQNLFAKWSINL